MRAIIVALLMQCGLPREVAEKIYDYRCAEFLDARSCVEASFSTLLPDVMTECAQVDLQTRNIYLHPLQIIALAANRPVKEILTSHSLVADRDPDSSSAYLINALDEFCKRLSDYDPASLAV